MRCGRYVARPQRRAASARPKSARSASEGLALRGVGNGRGTSKGLWKVREGELFRCYSPLESAFSKNLSSWSGLFRRRPCELSREPLAFKGGSLRVSSRSRDSVPLPPLVAGLFGSLPHGRRRKRRGQRDPPGQVFWNRSPLWGLKPGILVLEPLFCVDISVL